MIAPSGYVGPTAARRLAPTETTRALRTAGSVTAFDSMSIAKESKPTVPLRKWTMASERATAMCVSWNDGRNQPTIRRPLWWQRRTNAATPAGFFTVLVPGTNGTSRYSVRTWWETSPRTTSRGCDHSLVS